MNCPECDAAMDMRSKDSWNAHWMCPFDGQIVWAPTTEELEASA